VHEEHRLVFEQPRKLVPHLRKGCDGRNVAACSM
jgi:hypothetical protein